MLFTLVCGVAGMLLRLVMMIYGCDTKGLLSSGHFSIVACWVIALGYLAGLVFGVRGLGERGSYEQLFSASPLCGGVGIAAGGMLAAVSLTDTFVAIKILGVIAGACMVYTGVCRFSGKKPYYMFHFMVCLFFIVKLVLNYRGWSADPQLQDYAFQMLACVLLMLAAYYRASADAGCTDPRKLAFTCLAACFMCVVSLSDPETPLYYGACGLWALGSVGRLEPIQRESKD